MIKCCIFDLDGTLLNTLDTIHYYIVRAMDEYGYPAISRDACRSFVGNGARLLIERAMNSVGEFDKERIDEVFLLYNQLYDSEPLHLTAPYEGIVEMLGCIKANGIKIAVLSNKPHSATEPLVKEIFGELVDIAKGKEEGIPLKPDPTSALRILSSLGIEREECAFIGDTSVDISTARNLGAALALGVSWGFRDREDLVGAHVIIDSPSGLLHLLSNCT